MIQQPPPIRIAILQRVLPAYRVHLFKIISANVANEVRIFIGEDLPDSKARSITNFGCLDVIKLPTRFFKFGARYLLEHRGLKNALATFDPDVIICEGESNFLSYLKAIWYRKSNSRVALIHWSLGGLPGAPITNPVKHAVKRYLLSKFETFIVYSSYGRGELLNFGCSRDRIHVAVNVSNTQHHLIAYRDLALTREEVRNELCLPMKFTVLYAGTIEDDKRLETLIKALAEKSAPACNLVVLGDGPMLSDLKLMALELGLHHSFFPGSVSLEVMAKYYRAGDVFVLPGRGGMVISEAMAHGLPVIVHQADGVEFDLVQDGITGYRLDNNSAEAIRAAITKLWNAPEEAAAMGVAGQRLIERKYTSDSMAKAIQAAVVQAIKQRAGGSRILCE